MSRNLATNISYIIVVKLRAVCQQAEMRGWLCVRSADEAVVVSDALQSYTPYDYDNFDVDDMDDDDDVEGRLQPQGRFV